MMNRLSTPTRTAFAALVTAVALSACSGASPGARITTLVRPWGVAADAQGNIWASDHIGNAIDEFAPNADGNATPLRKLAGAKTHLKGPGALAIC